MLTQYFKISGVQEVVSSVSIFICFKRNIKDTAYGTNKNVLQNLRMIFEKEN